MILRRSHAVLGGDVYQKMWCMCRVAVFVLRAVTFIVADVVAKAPSQVSWFSSETEPNEPGRKIKFLNFLILPINVICIYLWFLMIFVPA